MTAAWMWARSELRARWRSWVILGLLAGATFGLAAAGLGRCAPHVGRAPPLHRGVARPDRRGPGQRSVVRRRQASRGRRAARGDRDLPVPDRRSRSTPSRAAERRSVCIPTTAASARLLAAESSSTVAWPIRRAPTRSSSTRTSTPRSHLGIGSTMTLGADDLAAGRIATLRPGWFARGVEPELPQKLRVVGISKSVDSEQNCAPSAGFYAKYGSRLAGFVNEFIDAAPRRSRPSAVPRRRATHRRASRERRELRAARGDPEDPEHPPRRAGRPAPLRARGARRRRRARRAGAGPRGERGRGRHADVAGDRRRPPHRGARARAARRAQRRRRS